VIGSDGFPSDLVTGSGEGGGGGGDDADGGAGADAGPVEPALAGDEGALGLQRHVGAPAGEGGHQVGDGGIRVVDHDVELVDPPAVGQDDLHAGAFLPRDPSVGWGDG
jgi:hypothetical protein